MSGATSGAGRAPAVRLEGVNVTVAGRSLLQVTTLVIAAGERVAVVGPNGAGKTTLLRLIAGLTTAASGHVEVLGRPIGPQGRVTLTGSERRALRREVGLVMQGLHLVPRLTARENVLVGALGRLRGADAWRSWFRWYPSVLVEEADAALAALGLGALAGMRTDRLSGGERQKVSLARVRLQRPRLVLADEPTSALDPAATAQVCGALRAAADAQAQTLVSVVHDIDLLPALATRVIGIAQGGIQWDAPVEALTPQMLAALYALRLQHGEPQAPAAERWPPVVTERSSQV